MATALVLGWLGLACPAFAGPVDRQADALRAGGDLHVQRRFAWDMAAAALPAFEAWPGEGAAFAPAGSRPGPTGIRGFDRAPSARAATETALAPVIAYTLYNAAAFEHLRRYRLYSRPELDHMRATATSIPDFPRGSAILKSVWWPIAGDRPTAMPVWDPDANPPRALGNPYVGWPRVVAVVPPAGRSAPVRLAFAGRTISGARRIDLAALYHVRLDDGLARRIMGDAESAKVAWMVLGRPLRAGDQLALVGANLAAREAEDWVWAALWWHDRPDEGPFAADRPDGLRGVWRNYLMQTAFDPRTPTEADGAPHVAFNPWLEARFPDDGQGGGVVSNCLSCHLRASYPPSGFLPVTRGPPDAQADPALASGKLRTGLVWSVPLHARP
jgi:hypothetical protein